MIGRGYNWDAPRETTSTAARYRLTGRYSCVREIYNETPYDKEIMVSLLIGRDGEERPKGVCFYGYQLDIHTCASYNEKL